ncbi:hypothetical protein Val02_72240 [Virgisporangium aliadipatigenens]|uniref:EccD-like transmembrane domain-containing protein n=1 Tax=Virgisporangium aliadipatigenens TaxID=741659 RepID=A0A8J4DUQ9_9ACTN|nr:type VII secretion integral membrane protein EccD [Virgisporangium aliadipatigenens]GIJ50338.1 hypothetical protein Val02_72240 [Virgisporangium aliadipatigenens]
MSAALNDRLCRVTVIGPDRRADLVVPVTVPVAELLPALLRHTSDPARRPEANATEQRSWVLQRLGQEPFAPTGTPESLDWLEGEQLHLRPAENPLPELDFDDLAEGIATHVNRRADRWRPEYRRVLFLALSAVCVGAIAGVLVDRQTVPAQVLGCGVLTVGFLVATLVSARRHPDGALALLFATAAAFFAAVGAWSAVDGDPGATAVTRPAVIAAAVAVVAVCAVLLLAQRTVARVLPALPLSTLLLGAAVVGVVSSVPPVSGMSQPEVAAVTVAVIYLGAVLAPRMAVKLSGLRGPQLPRTGAEMSYDIEPTESESVRARTDDADTYVTATLAAAAFVLPVLFVHTLRVPNWSGPALVSVVCCGLLLSARTFLGLWQRTALVAAGTAGVLMLVGRLSGTLSTGWYYLLLLTLVASIVPLVLAALRPWPRRMLPIWEYTATFFDVACGAAVLPILAQALGLYAWARGLFG